ncbi:MAG TPA: multidrug efflux SMR transporter [Methylocella sp.]|nr:multidrug efflux SMR transporter [Methylocella sp.]
MAWLLLIFSGLCEAVWATALKYSEGFSRLSPSITTVTAMGASLGLFGLAVKTLPISTAYVVWTGIGAVATTTAGMDLFSEPLTVLKLVCIGLILAGIAGLRLSS